jgi:hypothetical protein
MRYLLAGCAALVVLGFPGCSDDDGGGRETFVEQADSICSDAQVQISRVQQPQDPRDPLQLALFLERAVPIARAQNRRLKTLERPEADRARINQFLGALDAEVDAAERMLAAARRENREAVQVALQDSGLASAQARQSAQSLGLQVCGGAGGGGG